MKTNPKNRGRAVCLPLAILAWLTFCLLGLSGHQTVRAAEPPFRPPAVPLVAHDPYFSIWSPADQLTGADTIHWTGKPHRLASLVRIDGKAFRLMGSSPAAVPPLPQTSLAVWSTRTVYHFEGAGIRLALTFLTPALPGDLQICSRPVTYLSWEVQSLDGQAHTVSFFCGAASEIAVNDPGQPVVWSDGLDQDGLLVLHTAHAEQPVLGKKGDDLRIDWGRLYLVAPQTALPRANAGPCRRAQEQFARDGSLPLSDARQRRPAKDDLPGIAVAMDASPVSSQPVSRWIMLAYDDEYSIQYFRQNLRPYWRRGGDDAAALLRQAAADYEALRVRCAKFDDELMADLRQAGGEKYARVCALAYRQTFAGNKLAADAQGQPLLFPKENFSNGCIGTVDVLFPQAPFFLLFSPALTKAMLVPILDYAASPRWPYGYAPHDLGTYPQASGQVYGMGGSDGDRMPVEESGNMLIMLAALAKQEGQADLAERYWPMLTRWADYLVKEGLDPQNQLCSADMFGHLPRAANLALKAIIGIGGYAQLCEKTGRPAAAERYFKIARDYAAQWLALAKDDGRTRLAYHLPGTWGMKHNLIWDRVLQTGLFPEAVGDHEIAWYLKVQKPYGLPVDNRTDTSLIDWALWSIAPARQAADFRALFDPIYRYVHETPSRVPLSDWFVTTDARQKGFQARPVVGGIFIKLLAQEAAWASWAKRGANTAGPWAPIPSLAAVQEVVPTAQTARVPWRYTLEEPAAGWARPGFDDRGWKEGPGGFGTPGTPGAIIGTEWNTKRIWLRREFTLPERPLKNPRLLLIYDEDPEVYLNGVLAAKLTGWITSYDEAAISSAALATLQPGKNVIAVRASQTYGGQCVDAGLVEDGDSGAVRCNPSSYRGWKTVRLGNGLVELQVLPEIGGRVIQFNLGGKEFLWANPQLAGQLPPAGGLAADGGWFNAGGDKLWPAPQGWDNDRQWPGPPDAVLDGQPYALQIPAMRRGETAIQLTSQPDPRSGIQFSRTIRLFEGSTHVSFEATMKNIDTRPRRWGLWAHTQLNGARADGAPNPLLKAWCPINPQSRFPKGYSVIFGAADHPSYQPEARPGLLRVQYQYQVGKIGLDSPAGWVATVDGETGAVFVQRFVFERQKEYPDGSSVEFWLNGPGRIRAFNRELELPADATQNPYVFESEVLSPFASLEPGQTYAWQYDWYACNIGGDFPVVGCSEAGLAAEPLTATAEAGQVRLKGRFGVFGSGVVRAEFTDARGQSLRVSDLAPPASPATPLVVDAVLTAPAAATSVKLVLYRPDGKSVGELARAGLPQPPAAEGRWPADKAWQWQSAQPWLAGFNYIPATAINTTEMWQDGTFDPPTIAAELALAERLGFNCARVFVHYLVWENDPQGLVRRMEQFLAIAHQHQLRTLFVLFDDCAFSTMTEPFLGRQPEVLPGEYANGWTPSPGPRRVQDRAAWPKLEAYVGALTGHFRDDPRILGWDLYNEPGNSGMGNKSLPLLEAVFKWARRTNPSQPLTAGVWGGTPEITRLSLDQSDVVSFHSYSPAAELERRIAELRSEGRPLLCTEWLNRPLGSVAETCLPVLARQRVGAFHWGLVNGKTQTQFPWGSKAGAPEPKVWQHDLFRPDRTPYDPRELALFEATIRQAKPATVTIPGQWPAEKAWLWHSQRPWLVGCNFLPSTAVNDVEMWRRDTFDATTMDRELGWAQELGFNTVRVFLNFVVWREDPAGLKERFAQFLRLADRHGISVMPILFDDCNFAGRVAAATPQPDPVPGVHNSQWVSSPPLAMVTNRASWGPLEQYVKDLVGTFARDGRIVIWDLYNEPDNSPGGKSLPLVEATFAWAREMQPTQPLTTGAWTEFNSPVQRRFMELSDIVSFHGYDAVPEIEAKLKICNSYSRPVVCTEWLVRRNGNTIEGLLPWFRDRQIGCYNWGLVAGRTQTYYPWGSPKGAPEPKNWQHDLLRADGTPYKARETQFIKVTTGRLAASVLPMPATVVPTAEQKPVPWRYTLEQPDAGWFKPEFNDSAWKPGAAPFGTEEAPFARHPHTTWTSKDLWARREFELPAGHYTGTSLRLHHDEDTEVYFNGVLALKAGGYNAAYESFTPTPEALATLKPGKNLVAAHCRQTTGGQYFDLGLIDEAGAGHSPVLPGLRRLLESPLRDTSICLGPDNLYYLTGTSGSKTGGPEMKDGWWYVNEGIRVWRSADLVTWTPLGLVWIFEKNATWQKPVKNGRRALWAPEIHYLKGTFWLTYCINWGGTGLLKSTSGRAEGPYQDVQAEGPLTGEIDASLFQDRDGQVYFVFQNGKIARLKEDMSGLAEAPRLLRPANAVQTGFEGAFLTLMNGRYTLVCAEFNARNGHSTYDCMVSQADHIYGPYGDRYLAVPHGGHNMFFQDRQGQWWATFFGNDPRAPWLERPGILPIRIGPNGRVEGHLP